jgi:hypothetical protein
MEITLLSKRNYNILRSIHEKFPNLTFQNDGYQYIEAHVKLTQKDRQAINIVTLILFKCIHHFHSFNNFKLRKNGDVTVRIQYNWDPEHRGFVGAGYVPVEELRHGFSHAKEGPIFFQDDLTKDSTIEERVNWIQGLNSSGYAGMKSNGNIVDRREFPDAVEIQANKMLGIVEPKTHEFTV